jgi:cytochrome o ubiquinol oxidase subunit 3
MSSELLTIDTVRPYVPPPAQFVPREVASEHRTAATTVLGFLLLTFLLGLCFIGLEVKEFIRMVGEGAGPDRSAFLSAFFTLVGTHGLHVTSGLVWMAVMMVQTSRREFDAVLPRRLTCLSLFWHFLDIIWIGVFTVVYLAGAMS